MNNHFILEVKDVDCFTMITEAQTFLDESTSRNASDVWYPVMLGLHQKLALTSLPKFHV